MAMPEAVVFDKEEKYIHDFLSLPRRLYNSKTCTQNEREEETLLRGTHVLSEYFDVHGILVYQNQIPAARCIVTLYPGDENAYLGFFESIMDEKYADAAFQAAQKIAGDNGRVRLIGPVNASFWIGYRLKTNSFGRRPYFGEPYNLSYYPELFRKHGFVETERYTSNHYGRFPLVLPKNDKSSRRYREFLEKGYTFVSPNAETIESDMREIYRMITVLYRDFPIFKAISEEDFVSHFAGFQKILDCRFVKLVYFKGEAVGFTVGVPDYQNLLCGRIRPGTIVRLLLKKIRSRRYISLYMGVMPGHLGLGNAMSELLVRFVRKRRATTVSALIRDGKPTKGYQQNKIQDRFTYGLFTYEIGE